MEKDLDIKLYNEYLDGNKEAFELLYNKYKEKIQYFIYNIVKDYQKAEDITQDTFVYVMQNKIKEGYTFKYYIYLVAKSRAYNYINTEKKRTEINETYILHEFNSIEQDVADIVTKNEKQKEIINAINMPLSYYEDAESKLSAYKFIKNIKLNVEKSNFNILLSHTPNWIFKNNKEINNLEILKNMDIILCGHNHGGLMPVFLQDIINNHYGLVGPYSKVFQSNAYGIYNEGDTSILISNGVTKISETSPLGKISHILNKIYIPEIDIINMVQSNEHSLKLKKRSVIKF